MGRLYLKSYAKTWLGVTCKLCKGEDSLGLVSFDGGIVDGSEDGNGEDEEDEAESPWDGQVDVA